MNFKIWLQRLEEAQNNRSRSGEAFADRGTAWGAASHFGGQRAMLPISPGFDNRAFAGVMDAVGKSRQKELERVGAEPGIASRYDSLEDIRRDVIRTANMPLQLPVEGYNDGDHISITKGLIAKMKSTFNSPLNSPRVYRVDNASNLVYPQEQGFTKLYTFRKSVEENENELEAAINYTTALIQASFAVELSKWAHLLNLERPNTKDRQTMNFPLQPRQGNEDQANPYRRDEDPEFYKVLMCVLEFKSKKNAPDVGDDLDFRKYRNQNQNQGQNQGQAPGTSSSTVSAGGANPGATVSTVSP